MPSKRQRNCANGRASARSAAPISGLREPAGTVCRWSHPLTLNSSRSKPRRSRVDRGGAARACLRGCGLRLFSWSVRVDDLEAVSERLGIEIFDYTIPHGDGTLRGWRSVTGPPHLPFFIDYPNNGDRVGRWQELYERVGHTCSPRGFSELTISGSESEMLDWLGPHRLPLRFIEGQRGICEVRIATDNSDLVIR
jgi:hypothetical protein